MMKKWMICLLALAVLLLAGCAKKPQETMPVENPTQATEEAQIQEGPLEDNIFNDDAWNQESETTAPSEADKEQDSTNPTEATRPGGDPPDSDGPVDPPASDDPDPTSPTTKDPNPTENPGNDIDVPDPEDVDYRMFMDMTPAEQQAFMESFESIEAFFEWYEAAKEKYEKENPPIDVGDGNVTIPG